MRATIKLEMDVDKVDRALFALALEETTYILQAVDLLESMGPTGMTRGISDALDKLSGAAAQLAQYRDLSVDFERAKTETILPRPAEQPVEVSGDMGNNMRDVRESLDRMKGFSDFLDSAQALSPDSSGEGDISEDG